MLPLRRPGPWMTRTALARPVVPLRPLARLSQLIYPDQPRSVKHHDLPSFLRHAERAGLDPATTTFVGTHFEYTVAARLAPLGFALRRVGGASDRGIDLLGTWTLPVPAADDRHCRAPLRVLVQCKAGSAQRVGPSLVRELEGAFVGAPAGWRSRVGEVGESDTGSDGESDTAAQPPVVGLLATEKPATKGIRDALARSRWPLAYLCCSGAGHLQQMLWNRAAEHHAGLAGLGVALRHATDDDGQSRAHIVLAWHGKPLPSVAPSPDTPAPHDST